MNKTQLRQLFTLEYALFKDDIPDSLIIQAANNALIAGTSTIRHAAMIPPSNDIWQGFTNSIDFGPWQDLMTATLRDYIINHFSDEELKQAAYHGGLPEHKAKNLADWILSEKEMAN